MAIPCIYTYKGKDYSYSEFRAKIAREGIASFGIDISGGGGKTPKAKNLRLGERILDSENVSEEIKSGLRKKGIEYIPINLEVTQADAKAYVDSFVEAGELDKAISNVTDMSNGMPGLNRAAIGKELYEVLADKAKAAKTPSEQQKFQDKAVDIIEFTAQNFRAAGQEINAAKAWKRMLERTPEGAIASIKKRMREANAEALKTHNEDIRSAKEIIDEFVNSDEFKKLVGDKVQAEMNKLSNKAPKKENVFNSKSARNARMQELKSKWDSAKGGSLSSSIIGLNKEQVEILGEMALLHIIDGVVKISDIAAKLKKDFGSVTPEQVNELFENHEIAGKKLSEYADERKAEKFEEKTINDALKIFSGELEAEVEAKAFKAAFKGINKKELLDQLEKKLSKLKPESRRKLLANALEEIERLGGLSDQRFRDLYAKELGLPTLTPETESHIRELTDRINKVDNSSKELIDAIDSGATKAEINAKKKQWMNDVFDGQKANAEISEYFRSEKEIGSTLSTILQGSLLNSLSLIKNVYSNTLIQPLRFASRGLSSSGDYLMAKAQPLPIMNKLIKEGRTIDALAYWKGESKGVLPGLKTGFKELILGINPEEMIERDMSQQLQPLRSMIKLFEGLTGKEKQTAYQQLNNFTEATFGAPAEVMFRLLNLGDKPFRKAAEYGAAYEIGTLKGLKGAELDKFVLFPDSASAELIKIRAERAVYQQSEGATKVAQGAIRSFEKYVSEIPVVGDVTKILFKSQIPYTKTPLNLLGETINFALPHLTLAKGAYYAFKGDRREALDLLSKAVIGFAIQAAITALIDNGLVTGDPDKEDLESIAIQNQNIPANSINITGLQRMATFRNPATLPTDVWIDYKNMGVIGMLINVHANKIGVPKEQRSYLSDLFTTAASVSQAAIQQSFLQGTSAFLEAITGDERTKRKWAINTLGALGSIVYPNVIATASKASDDYVRSTKAEMFSDELINTFKVKMFMGDELPTKVNLWGESIKGAPADKSKFAWYMFNATKGRKIDADSYNFKIYEFWNSIEDDKTQKGALPSFPRDYLTINKEKVKLSPKLYEEYQMMVGKNRGVLVEQYTKSPNWKTDDEDTKIKTLKTLYEEGASNGKEALIFNHPELKPKTIESKEEEWY
jgi:hypothetical protein